MKNLIFVAFFALLQSVSPSAWAGANLGSAEVSITTILIDPSNPDTVYAQSGSGKLFKSTDGGGNWNVPNNTGLPTGASIQSLILVPSTPSTLYVGLSIGRGVYKSTNGGGSWLLASTGLPAASLVNLIVDPSNPATLYANYGTSLYKSTDSGSSWNPISGSGVPTGWKLNEVFVDPAQSTTLYARYLYFDPNAFGGSFGQSDKILKSKDGGGSWSVTTGSIGNGASIGSFAIAPTIPSTLYAQAYADLYKSTDGGQSWVNTSNGLSLNWAVPPKLTIDPVNPTILVILLCFG